MKIKRLESFSNDDLEFIREALFYGDKEFLVREIDEILTNRKNMEEERKKSLNESFLVDDLNIDQAFKDRLKQHGIYNMEQLLAVDLADISVEGTEAREQYKYAREMFDFSKHEKQTTDNEGNIKK